MRRTIRTRGLRSASGLIGAAHGGHLMLDEIGELPEGTRRTCCGCWMRAEYQRLGEARRGSVIFRLIAATNRAAQGAGSTIFWRAFRNA